MGFFDFIDTSTVGKFVYFWTTVMILVVINLTVFLIGKFTNIYENLSLKRRFGLQKHNWALAEITALDKGIYVKKIDLDKTGFFIGKGADQQFYTIDKNAIQKYFKGVPILVYEWGCPFPVQGTVFTPDIKEHLTINFVQKKPKFDDNGLPVLENGVQVIEDIPNIAEVDAWRMKPVKYIDLSTTEVAVLMQRFLEWAIVRGMGFSAFVKQMLIALAVGVGIGLLIEGIHFYVTGQISGQVSTLLISHNTANTTAITLT